MEKFAVAGYDLKTNQLQVKVIEGREEILKFILNNSSKTNYFGASPEKKEQIIKEIYGPKGFFVEYQYKFKFKVIPIK